MKRFLIFLSSAMILMACTVGEKEENKDSYEPDDEVSLAKDIGMNVLQQRTLHSTQDVDWIRFRTKDGGYYKIVFSSEAESNNQSLLKAYLYDSDLLEESLKEGNEYSPIRLRGDGGWGYIKVISVGKKGRYEVKIED